MSHTLKIWYCMLLAVSVCLAGTVGAHAENGAEIVSAFGYEGCIRLFNGTTEVILEPNCGGRVMSYTLDGVEAIFVDPSQNGWVWEPGEPTINPTGGRLDIGPERLNPSRPTLWLGRWSAEIYGPRAGRMTSQPDPNTGVQLVREFVLDDDTSHLRVTQIIKNVSDETKQYFHWSRTFSTGSGICLIPLSEGSRFPQGYGIYGPGPVVNYDPSPHENIRVRDGFLEILGIPPQPKFAIDSYTGWFGYLTRDDLLFVKRFPVYPDRVYGEVCANTISIWYPASGDRCEIEPIGPRETLAPGMSASFTEEWWLLSYRFPGDDPVDLDAFTRYVNENTR